VCVSVNMQTDQRDSEHELEDKPEQMEMEMEENEEEENRSHAADSRPGRTLLLVFRIMFYPAFEWYAFPSESKTSLVSAGSRRTIDDQVISAFQAR